MGGVGPEPVAGLGRPGGRGREGAAEDGAGRLAVQADRERFLSLLGRFLADRRVPTGQATAAQRAVLARVQSVLAVPATQAARANAGRKAAVARHDPGATITPKLFETLENRA